MFFRNKNNITYIFCVPLFRGDIKKCNKAQSMDSNEIKNSICDGINSRKAVFSLTLLSKESAHLLAQSWNTIATNIPNNYWIIELKITQKEYGTHRKKTGFGSMYIGKFLHPLQNNIISCVSGNGVELSASEWKLETKIGCAIL